MITIKKPEEINILREGGKILASVLRSVEKEIRPGVATIELDALAEKLVREAGGEPSFKNYKSSPKDRPYPASLCCSVNSEIVHGIPSKDRILKYGDILTIDLGVKYKGLFTDAAITVPVGAVSEETKKLIQITKLCLDDAINVMRVGARLGDVGFVIQERAEKNGFSIVDDLVGHGVGYAVHEKPEIPNFGRKGAGLVLKEGMVLAIEPMLATGNSTIVSCGDGWAWKMKDGSLSAHFEHTVAITENGPEVLTM